MPMDPGVASATGAWAEKSSVDEGLERFQSDWDAIDGDAIRGNPLALCNKR
jgi:hypothetical protein